MRALYQPWTFRCLSGALTPATHRSSSTYSAFQFIVGELFYPDHVHMKLLNSALVFTHDYTQMPWSWTIVGTAFVIRTLFNSPFYVYSEKNQSKVLHITLDCIKTKPMLLKKLQESPRFRQLDPLAAQKWFDRMGRQVFRQTCESNHCHPMKSAAAAIMQVPLWLSFSFTLRYMCGFQMAPGYGTDCVVPEMIMEGLKMACSSPILPVALLLVNLANVELVYLRHLRPPSSISAPEKHVDSIGYRFGRGVGWVANGLVFSVSLFLPKALVIYWCTSSVHQFLTHLVVMHPRVRELCGIWRRPHEGNHPYRNLLDQAKARYRLLRYIFYSKRT